ncbi:MAG TPA: transcriptional repressor [Acidimicrobiales bacterium]|nr:transcriptional repressor [Acidimicrobiales bacterium]
MDASLPPPADSDRLGFILELLGREGHRVTVGRRAVVEALLSAEGHLSADDLVAELQQVHPGLHRATVYRSLEALEAAGLVEHVHLGHGRSVYHLTDDLHQHLVCEVCGSVEEAPSDLLSAVARRLRRERGFVMRPYHFAVLGRCRTCVAEADAEVRHGGSGRDRRRAGGPPGTVVKS